MISFKKFLRLHEEVVSTRRQGIQHLQEMPPEIFIQWMRSVRNELGGVLKNIKSVMKIDGIGFRFGKDISGKVFIEGSRTGPISEVGAFSAYARNKTDNVEIIARAVHYDNILELFKNLEIMKSLPSNTKVVSELFYNPMAKENETGITFVSVQYDKSKLGSLMTIMPYTVLQADIGLEHLQKEMILKNLYSESNDKVKIIDPNLKFEEIDITAFVEPASTITDSSLEIVKSRKQSDRVEKQNILNIIQKIKDDLSDYLLSHPGIEGKFKLDQKSRGSYYIFQERTAYSHIK